MGKQLQIYSTEKDNEKIAEFLESNFDCDFYQNFSSTKEGLLIKGFEDTHPLGWVYIHNKAFPWMPTYSQTNTDEKLYYIDNMSLAPIIEFSKTNIKEDTNGRIYWSKYFSGNPTEYNITEFEKFYDTFARWIKKNASGTVKSANLNIYYFEDAWKKYQSDL